MAKYTITIADIELNISTEESPEMVDRLVTSLDRRIRDLLLRMPRLSKSEAAILCAVDYCAQNIKTENKKQLAKMHELLRCFLCKFPVFLLFLSFLLDSFSEII